MTFPEDLYYTKEHEWVRFDDETGHAWIGITEYAQDKLGDIVHVDLPDEEEELRENEPFGSVESVKAVSDIYAPTSGTIVEINSSLEDSPELLNEDPYEDGWIIRIKVDDPSFIVGLMDPVQYAEFIESEGE